MMILVQIMMV